MLADFSSGAGDEDTLEFLIRHCPSNLVVLEFLVAELWQRDKAVEFSLGVAGVDVDGAGTFG